ncbi:dihydrofolate reductase [Luteococcus sp. Sow4_B9]|uniref:dihydrofolate reductase n=1 Tax=Luteococcus sp. Sow4_B9 TaxID=3438792 RepID=UPI003F9B090D
MRVIAIAVVSENGVIGDGQDQPFKFREDWARFKQTTLGHPIILGRHTHEAIGGYLPGRTTIVVSRDPEQIELSDDPDAPSFAVGSVELALELAESLDDVCFVCGGGQVYENAWEYLTELDITQVHQRAEGTVLFPEIDPEEWLLLHREPRAQFDFTRLFPITRTDRLTLVPVGPDDLDDWARLYSASDLPEVPLERHRVGLEANVEHWLNDGLGYWLAKESLHDRPVGVGGVRRSKENPDDTWSLYYRFEEGSRNQGYAVEIAKAGVAALKVLDPDSELRAVLRPDNAAACAVAEKVGLLPTGETSDERGPLQIWSAVVATL